MAVVTMKQLLDSGTHFGHQTRRWNPKMKRFIFTDRNGIYIIDLQQTLTYIDWAYEFVKESVAHGGSITGEHGVGHDKACSMPKMFTGADLTVMDRLRSAFDPERLSNPGKLLPS